MQERTQISYPAYDYTLNELSLLTGTKHKTVQSWMERGMIDLGYKCKRLNRRFYGFTDILCTKAISEVLKATRLELAAAIEIAGITLERFRFAISKNPWSERTHEDDKVVVVCAYSEKGEFLACPARWDREADNFSPIQRKEIDGTVESYDFRKSDRNLLEHLLKSHHIIIDIDKIISESHETVSVFMDPAVQETM